MNNIMKYILVLALSTIFCLTAQAEQKVVQPDNNTTKQDGVWNDTKEVSSDVWDGTKEVSSDVWDGTKKVSSDVWDGAKQVGSDIKSAVTESK